MKHRISILLAVILLSIAGQPRAQSDVQLSGFGTLSASHLSSKQFDYAPNVQPYGPGRTVDTDFGLDSRLGLQLDGNLANNFRWTVQTTVYRQPDRDYRPVLTLAHATWIVVPEISLKLGRMQDNSFLASDYRLANLPNPWVRPPPEVYGIMPLIHEDGIAGTWKFPLGSGYTDVSLALTQGDFEGSRSNQTGVDPIKVRDLKRLVARWQESQWQLKASVSRREVTYLPDSMTRALNLMANFDPALARELALIDKRVDIYTLGASWEDNDWLVQAEWVKRRSVSAFANAEGGYLTLGRRLGAWMPFATISYRHTEGPSGSSGDATAQAILVKLFEGQRRNNRTLSLGTSYALSASQILRAQVDFINPGSPSWGSGPYHNHAPDFDPNRPPSARLYTLGVDFIF
jgi:hypothetical protein